MRKPVLAAALSLIMVFGVLTSAAEAPPESYVNAMKSVAAALQNVNKAMKTENFKDVVTAADAMKPGFEVVKTYWDIKKVATPLGWAKDGIKAIGDLQTAAALDSKEGVEYALKELTATCMSCHTAHREKMPDGTFGIVAK